MDTFFEQIVSIKKSGKNWAVIFIIWFFAIAISAFLVIIPLIRPLAPILVLGLGYGSWWLASKFNVEYEYIVTNGSMDVDKILNKSKRSRISSFEIANVERLEKFNIQLLKNVKRESIVYACNQNDPNAYLMVASREDTKVNYIVFAPNKKLQNAIKKSLPKFIANSAFQ